jgi:hypothetical protein
MLHWLWMYAASVCYQMFQLFQTYVASVLSGCCICYCDHTSILQVYVLNVLTISNVYCKCFIWMLHMSQWSYICKSMFKIFHLFQMMQQILHVASVSWADAGSGCTQRWSPWAQWSQRLPNWLMGRNWKGGARASRHVSRAERLGASKALSTRENGASIGKLILLLETHSLQTATKIYYAKDFVYKKYHNLGKNI